LNFWSIPNYAVYWTVILVFTLLCCSVFFADPVAVRHSLEILSELATRDPYTVAMTLEKLASPTGALQDILHMNDVLARVSLARLCHSISRARALDGKYYQPLSAARSRSVFFSSYLAIWERSFENLHVASFLSIFLQRGLILGLSSTQFSISYS
jgi:hypothetical protein